ncbi:non-specific lipid-transfer protein-like [Herrania umbratica]|uniref:Non-specific lipid-transfer protein n=1 Tax=Herrania umbratica TaxID=108875 RepID=A0A6J1A1F6_9ROSI|nr:non-specific lipid-transfer protein-like [Herrania umbratica]
MAVSIKFLAMLVLLMLSALATAETSLLAPSCADVTKAVAPCLDFLKGKGGADPSRACCDGAGELAKETRTKNDRQAVCECLKTALGKVGSYDASRVPLIAKKCNVDINIPPITDQTDCSKAL